METVSGAQQRILAGIVSTPVERVPLRQARGRVLARPVISTREIPALDNSAMDGYAVIAADLASASDADPVELAVLGESRAGTVPTQRVTAGTAIRIMTGAPMPGGADSVVRHEDTDNGRVRVRVRTAVAPGRDVRRAGEDMRPGDEILEPGRRLRSFDLAASAALGLVELAVHRRPRVAVLSTGDELVEPEQPPGPGQVPDSNRVAVIAAVEEAGGVPVDLGIARDRPEDLREKLERALECDIIVSTAGVSVGDHDHVRDVVEELGRIDLWQVAMRPGRPIAVGNVAGVLFLGLPGNPVSSQVTFELFARPAIRALEGAAEVHRRRLAARALVAMSKPEGLETFHRGRLVAEAESSPESDGLPGVVLTGPQGSGILRSLVLADCLVALPATGCGVAAGVTVEVLPLG
ncbi:MAG TPA: gephyrin-like molybdotransferase Glp [Candidatus Sulfotelmatobacter sp.]|nr:gephyrin-like molybdotransferase Glp [Candidatus Sulfotelmatobacter sp.]